MDALLTYLPSEPAVDGIELAPGARGLFAKIIVPVAGNDVAARWRSDLALTGAAIATEVVDDQLVFTLMFPYGVVAGS